MKTTKGLEIMGLQRSFDVESYTYKNWSARVRLVEGNPYYDDYFKWDGNGEAIDHDNGDITVPTHFKTRLL